MDVKALCLRRHDRRDLPAAACRRPLQALVPPQGPAAGAEPAPGHSPASGEACSSGTGVRMQGRIKITAKEAKR